MSNKTAPNACCLQIIITMRVSQLLLSLQLIIVIIILIILYRLFLLIRRYPLGLRRIYAGIGYGAFVRDNQRTPYRTGYHCGGYSEEFESRRFSKT